MAANELRGMNVLVSGAGAAGQTVAYWLARYGANVTVLERAPAPRIGGFATDIRGSALAVAEWMGVVDKMRQARVNIREMVALDADGERVWGMDGNFGIGYETGDIEILRDDLTSILAGAMSTVDTTDMSLATASPPWSRTKAVSTARSRPDPPPGTTS
jgi:2-polyprenyl-6-methoxyphenol hydroxylase-like FAD-dependent oxidoreductase